MEVYNYPLVSIVTVNYNGKRFLTSLFNSIKDLDYPPDRIQTILVDNSSTDGSIELVSRMFPWVEILRLEKNYGYAGGNNAGLQRMDGDYAALINNDCMVDRSWLKKLVETALEKNTYGKTGAVCSKVLFYYDYIPVRFEFENSPGKVDLKINYTEADDTTAVNRDFHRYIKLLYGFTPATAGNYASEAELQVRPGARMALPVIEPDIAIRVAYFLRSEEKTDLRIVIDESGKKKNNHNGTEAVLFSGYLNKAYQETVINIEREHLVYKRSLINSCGLEVNRNFYARDRGSDRWDEGQFNSVEEVFSPSGSSLLINKKMLEETGYFDDSFFTYYEDLDLFWRARLAGWKHYFTPGSIARHHHCGTGVEWSYSFSYHVLRNRLLAIFKCGWFGQFVKSYFSFVLSVFSSTFFYILSAVRGKKQYRPDIRARIRIFFELFYLIPKNLGKRSRIRNSASLGDSEISKWTIDF